MGPKKKNQRNDFYFFMQEQKKVLRRENRDWENMEELVQICHPRWKLLPDSDRARYKEMAKRAKAEANADLSSKYDALGRNLKKLHDDARDKENRLERMRNRIFELIDTARRSGTLQNEKFIFIHFNVLCEIEGATPDEPSTYLPCEVALAEYSLKEGITRTLHGFLRPSQEMIPIGYAYTIVKQAEDTHKLDLDAPPMKTKDAEAWSWIYRTILQFIFPEGLTRAMHPIFTTMEDAEKTEGILKRLRATAGGSSATAGDIPVFHLHELYYQLTKTLPPDQRPFDSAQLVKDKLNEDMETGGLGMFVENIACMFHKMTHSQKFCSLVKVKQWAYMISDYCCEPKNIPLIPGKHFPPGFLGSQGVEEQLPVERSIGTTRWWEHASVEPPPTEQLTMTGVIKTKSTPGGITPGPKMPQMEITTRTGSSAFCAAKSEHIADEYKPIGGIRPTQADGGIFNDYSEDPSNVHLVEEPILPVFSQGASRADQVLPNIRSEEDYPTLGGARSVGRGRPWGPAARGQSEEDFPTLGGARSAGRGRPWGPAARGQPSGPWGRTGPQQGVGRASPRRPQQNQSDEIVITERVSSISFSNHY